MAASPPFSIEPATEKDLGVVLRMIRALAEYEKMADDVVATEADLRQSLFGPRPAAEAVLAYCGDQPAGMALFFHNFSTFRGRAGLYLEDLVVLEAFRGQGVGKALMNYLAKLAVSRGCARFEWSVLDWNEPAIGFYRDLGARPVEQWNLYRLTDASLHRLAAEA